MTQKQEPRTKDAELEADYLRNEARKFRLHYGVRPSHLGKPEFYYRRPNTPKAERW